MIVHPEDVPVHSMGPGLRRRNMCVGPQTMLCRFSMEAGSAVPTHAHPHEQTGYCISGAFQLTIGDETALVRAGDAWLVPGATPHAAHFLEACELVEIFVPVREDYL